MVSCARLGCTPAESKTSRGARAGGSLSVVSPLPRWTVVSASALWNLFGFSIEHPNVPNNTVAASVGGRFTDRPTITYTPLMGERFARSMMTPVPPASVLSLIQAGYPVDLVLRLMVNVVNGLDNRH